MRWGEAGFLLVAMGGEITTADSSANNGTPAALISPLPASGFNQQTASSGEFHVQVNFST